MPLETKAFYMCRICWDHEIGETTVIMYKSLDELEDEHPCAKHCGIVRLEITAEIIEPGLDT